MQEQGQDTSQRQDSGHGHDPHSGHGNVTMSALTLGALGVVFGDIGTSPLYAFHDALSQTSKGGAVTSSDILGVLSLSLWALVVIVTLKYVLFLMRADNNGEGGVLSLMALAQRATQGKWTIVVLLGGLGASLFYGDSIIAPALSVLSAVEGLRTVPGIGPYMNQSMILWITLAILSGLFAIQSRGTAKVAKLFGPVCLLWFGVLAGLGVWHIFDQPGVLLAINPLEAAELIARRGSGALAILGAVFLTVTGAEALVADMGHFGRKPIQLGWFALVWPALTLNYLGQGALALTSLTAANGHFTNQSWFFIMAPEIMRGPLVVLAGMATVIASQAVITAAFSLTQQAVALGLVPRMTIRQTSADKFGQIYMPLVNWLILGGVVILVLAFQSSEAMAAAYGVAVTGAMLIDNLLAFFVAWKLWRWNPYWTALLLVPFVVVDVIFFGANMLRVVEGGWVPLMVASLVGVVMYTWTRGRRVALQKNSEQGVPMDTLAASLAARPPTLVDGVAVFLTQNPEVAPSALLHNLKHNKALHKSNVLLSVTTESRPHIPPEQRLRLEPINERFSRANLRYGYMDAVDVPDDLSQGDAAFNKRGGASFFVGRNAIRRASTPSLPKWMMLLFSFLYRNAADPTQYFRIPPNRVVELGTQIEL